MTRLRALDAGRVPMRRRQTGLATVELMVAVIIATALLSIAFVVCPNSGDKKTRGDGRKDRSLVPLKTDFDLFIGVASDY